MDGKWVTHRHFASASAMLSFAVRVAQCHLQASSRLALTILDIPGMMSMYIFCDEPRHPQSWLYLCLHALKSVKVSSPDTHNIT